MKRKILATLLGLALATVSEAQMITYIMVDNVCSRKQDYQLTKGSGVDFYDFYTQVPSSPQKRLTLRIPKVQGGLYVSQVQNLLKDAEVWQCADLDKLSPEMITEVNRELKVLQLVEKTATGFTLYQVKSIATYEETATSFLYQDPKFNFEYKYNQIYKAGENLSLATGKIMFQESKKEACVYRRSFKAFGEAANELPVTLQFVEGLGLVKIGQGNTEIELKSINGKTVATFVANICANSNNQPLIVENPKTMPNQLTARGGSTSLFGSMGEHVEIDYSKKVENKPLPNRKSNPETKPNGDKIDVNQLPRGNEEILKAEPGYHIVREGDNLYNLSLQYGTSVEAIQYFNNMQDDKLKLNQKLKVIDDGQNSYQDKNPQIVEDAVNRYRYTVHVVHQGDNLGKIAQRYNTSLLSLYQLNNLQDDKIAIRQQIIVAKETLP